MSGGRGKKRPPGTVNVAQVGLGAVIVGPEGITPEIRQQENERLKRRYAKRMLCQYRDTQRAGHRDDAWRKAARHLLPPSGRPEEDDRLAVARMQALLECGHAESRHEAAKIVATDKNEPSVESTVRRLERKFRQKYPT